ncbi:hypothetical protein [Streptomyces griseocarneus]|uniref:hypothetical protein n=1 Tax=Streptomyces griseocarneus TaxID=51201 RepID=UPI00167D5006|nr:hypothetical protein [Streptomyces griseocarneus]MBZ6473557.1 hypothetical protein [Streptomyces griseocarneus]
MVVVVIVVMGACAALPGDRVAAVTGLFGAVANLVVLVRHGKGGAGVRSHS